MNTPENKEKQTKKRICSFPQKITDQFTLRFANYPLFLQDHQTCFADLLIFSSGPSASQQPFCCLSVCMILNSNAVCLIKGFLKNSFHYPIIVIAYFHKDLDFHYIWKMEILKDWGYRNMAFPSKACRQQFDYCWFSQELAGIPYTFTWVPF